MSEVSDGIIGADDLQEQQWLEEGKNRSGREPNFKPTEKQKHYLIETFIEELESANEKFAMELAEGKIDINEAAFYGLVKVSFHHCRVLEEMAE